MFDPKVDRVEKIVNGAEKDLAEGLKELSAGNYAGALKEAGELLGKIETVAKDLLKGQISLDQFRAGYDRATADPGTVFAQSTDPNSKP